MTLLVVALLSTTSSWDVPHTVANASVTWHDANWHGELAAIPLGNGDVSATAFIDNATGSLVSYVQKSDAFDSNAMPIKVARLRFAFDPPLWSYRRDFAAPALAKWAQTLDVATASLRVVGGGYALRMYVDKLAPVLRLEVSRPDGAAFTINASLVLRDVEGANWIRDVDRKYDDLVATALVNESVQPSPFGDFCFPPTLTADVVVHADADAASPSVTWYHRNTGRKDPFRPDQPSYFDNTMRGQGLDPHAYHDPLLNLTFGGSLVPVATAAGTKVASFDQTSDTMLSGTVPAGPAATAGITLEATVHTAQTADVATWLTGLRFAVRRERARAADHREEENPLENLSETPAFAAHAAKWSEFWNRSFISTTLNPLANASSSLGNTASVANVNHAYVYQRYMDACDGDGSRGVIKFNGQAFTVAINATDGPGKNSLVAADYRDWGPSNWFQNMRQPYYATLIAGDTSIRRPFFEYFNRSLEIATARVAATMGIPGVYWPETATLFGTYSSGGLGWGCNGSGTTNISYRSPKTQGKGFDRHRAPPTSPGMNGYTRFYTSGSLELCLLALDDYAMTLDVETWSAYGLHFCTGVLTFYRHRFPRTNASTQKTDYFPSQVIESYWCGENQCNSVGSCTAWGTRVRDPKIPGAYTNETKPFERGECATNGTPDLAGLRLVITLLLKLPVHLTPNPEERAAWAKTLSLLPPLATGTCHYAGPGNPGGGMACQDPKRNPNANKTITILQPGEMLPQHQHNHENHAMYAVWPFRQYGVGRPNLQLGVDSYKHRPHACDHNWCQDVADAAVLGVARDAAENVLQRANAAPAASATQENKRPLLARFRGFSAHYEDYEPAVDQLSMMRIAMHEMLISRADDGPRYSVILFAGWPTESWDVDFKLWAPRNTTIEAACRGGVLTKLIVTPPSRLADVSVVNCKQHK
jgi:hypothetical protein